tara:strand:+ start:223 stop:930 length:708 start_codon:yes stop_codon:yes gene_type:complete
MNLPVLNTPTYEMEIPSTGEKIKYRPFLVKEQKLLMMAQESGDDESQLRTVGEIVKSCTFDKISHPEKLPTFDIEYMFLMTRAQSVGSKIPMTVTCPDDGETKVDYELNIDEIKVKKIDGHTNVIMLTDEIGITMKYPNLDMVKSFTNIDENITNISFDMIRDCIENIFDKDQVYDDMSSKDLQNFIEQMNTEQFEKVSQFFETMPKLTHVIKVTNPNTGVESEVVLEGLQSFLE